MSYQALLSIAIFTIISLYAPPVHCQAGELDDTFDDDGWENPSLGGENGSLASVIIQPDGKILAGGYIDYGSEIDFLIVRLNEDGSYDTSFGTDGIVTLDFNDSEEKILDIALQTDGKIVAVGYTNNTPFYDENEMAIVRFNSDGTPDNSFSGDAKMQINLESIDDKATTVAIQNDGKIVVGGYSNYGYKDGYLNLVVTRILTGGGIDYSFSGDGYFVYDLGGTADAVYDIALQSNGKIVVAGNGGSGNNLFVMRLSTTGSTDSSFSEDGYLINPIDEYSTCGFVQIAPDQKIYAGGLVNQTGTVQGALGILKYNSDGTPDNTFGDDGLIITTVPDRNLSGQELVIQPDGKPVVAGLSSAPEDILFFTARYNLDGSLDASYSNDGIALEETSYTNSLCYSAALQSDGKIVCAGYASNGGIIPYPMVMRFIGCSDNGFTETVSACLTYTWDETGETYTTSGDYSVPYIGAYGCDSTVTLDLTIYPLPNAGVNVSGNTLQAVQSGATYQWLDCLDDFSPIAGATSQSYTPTANGSYAVQITKNGCESTSDCYEVSPVFITENMYQDALIFPNPADGVVEISSTSLLQEMDVHGIDGAIILSISSINDYRYKLQLDDFPEGVYLLSIRYANGHVERKQLVKLKG
ncbi:MAG: T9SS type A sorting domain-containing protein [Flavobacteriales bacterium]|nr:T9SS type A sorting domain-containing protein [Flavobacteriales bacterium]